MRDKTNSILILTMNESTAGAEVSVDVPNLHNIKLLAVNM